MEQTPNLQLPYIMPSQAQKHVTHNEAIRTLDALVQLAVLDRDLSTPPGSPAEGDRYLVAAGGSAAWAGEDDNIAAWQDGAWAFLAPRIGWLVWVVDEMRLLSFDGAVWADAAVHSINPALLVGVNTTADTTDRLAVKSPASLFDQESGDHRLKINKAAAGDTASVLFQSGYSGRAEFGLAGDDNWHVKVSPDGAAWVEALNVDAATGRVRLPAALALSDDNQIVAKRHVREMLTANRTYYVRSDGSNSNSGLADTAGGAFLTIQKAWNVIVTLDLAGFTATINIGTGTFTAGLSAAVAPVGGNVIVNGNGAANTTISVTGGNAIINQALCNITVQNIRLQTTTSGAGLRALGVGAKITLGAGVTFGANADADMWAQGGIISGGGNAYTKTGNTAAALFCVARRPDRNVQRHRHRYRHTGLQRWVCACDRSFRHQRFRHDFQRSGDRRSLQLDAQLGRQYVRRRRVLLPRQRGRHGNDRIVRMIGCSRRSVCRPRKRLSGQASSSCEA